MHLTKNVTEPALATDETQPVMWTNEALAEVAAWWPEP